MSSFRRPPGGSVFTAIPPVSLAILVTCLVVWFIQAATPAADIWRHLALSTPGLFAGKLWQLVTYQALHDAGGLTHILFNMLGLLFFGPALERRWGSAAFLRYFLACGIGGGILFIAVAAALGDSAPVVGASGAILGLLVAWALIWPTRQILLALVIPIEIRHAVLILVLIDLMLAWLGSMGGNATGAVAHLGGALTGWAYIVHAGKLRRLGGPGAGNPIEGVRRWWRRRHMSVVDRDFEQWLKEQDDEKRH